MWKDIINYEDCYMIDENGNIFSKTSNKILSPYLNNKGYKCIDLKKNGKCEKFLIHRLVAIHFIPNPNNYPIVLHKDNVKTNTNVSNLSWGTYSENNAQAVRDNLIKVPKPDNTVYYEVYNPGNPDEKYIFKGLHDVIKANEYPFSNSGMRNFISRQKPISNGNYAGYMIKKNDKIWRPIRFIEFY